MKALSLFPFSTVTKLHCLQKPEKRGSENQFCLVGVPQGLVLGPSQISYSPGAMFFPPRSGTADRQSDCPSCAAWPEHNQTAHNSPEILPSGKRAQWSLCWRLCLYVAVYVSVFLCDTLPCHLILSHFPLTSQSKARRECIAKQSSHLPLQ